MLSKGLHSRDNENKILEMQNEVLQARSAEPSLASRSVDRALGRRREAYADEVGRLVRASFDLIRESGRLEPRVSDIVRRAGLSNQAFYRHFRSKDELLVTVLDNGIRLLGSYLRHRMQTAASPEQRIRRWISGMLEQAIHARAAAATRPFAVSRARLSERFPEEVKRSEQQLTEMLRRAIQDAVAAGELPGADPDRDAQTVYELAMGWMQQQLAQPAPAERADAEHLVEFAMRGLRRGATPRDARAE